MDCSAFVAYGQQALACVNPTSGGCLNKAACWLVAFGEYLILYWSIIFDTDQKRHSSEAFSFLLAAIHGDCKKNRIFLSSSILICILV